MTEGSNRRRGPRFVAGNLAATLRQPGIMGVLRKPETVTWMDYNRHGMCFESERKLAIGSRVLLDLAIQSAVALDVVATVRNKRRASSGKQRYGVEFSLPRTSSAATRSLASIETALRSLSPHTAKDSMDEQVDRRELEHGA
jgi:hypothetical protein